MIQSPEEMIVCQARVAGSNGQEVFAENWVRIALATNNRREATSDWHNEGKRGRTRTNESEKHHLAVQVSDALFVCRSRHTPVH